MYGFGGTEKYFTEKERVQEGGGVLVDTSAVTRKDIICGRVNVKGVSDNASQINISDSADSRMQLILGTDAAGGYSSIQSVQQNVSLRQLALNRAGGVVSVNGLATRNTNLDVNGTISGNSIVDTKATRAGGSQIPFLETLEAAISASGVILWEHSSNENPVKKNQILIEPFFTGSPSELLTFSPYRNGAYRRFRFVAGACIGNFAWQNEGPVAILDVAGQFDMRGNIVPKNTNTHKLGINGNVWNEIYATNTAIQTSDAREKKDVQYIDKTEALNIIKKLRPCWYKWIKNEAGRTHSGFIAQDVKSDLGEEFASNWGFFIHSPGRREVIASADGQETERVVPDSYGLRYGELVSPLVGAVQQLADQVSETQSELRKRTLADVNLEDITAQMSLLRELCETQSRKIEELKLEIDQLRADILD